MVSSLSLHLSWRWITPHKDPFPRPFLSCHAAGRSVLPPPQLQWLGEAGREPDGIRNSPQLLPGKKQQHHCLREVLAKVSFSVWVSNTAYWSWVAWVTTGGSVSVGSLPQCSPSAPCWEPKGLRVYMVGCLHPCSVTPITLDFFRAGYSLVWSSSQHHYCNQSGGKSQKWQN